MFAAFWKGSFVDILDPVFLSRLQFTFTVLVHFIFVPLSVGLGLFVAIFVTRAQRSGDAEHERQAAFLVKLFALVFTCGVATGITMEFSFGTNWADYSRFVGDIFGAPLAAEALLAFFLESTFLGVLLFGRGKVGRRLYTASAWLVWAGSALSALWILIANSWMQTPAGYTVDASTGNARLTDFFAAALNPETLPTYAHTVLALIIMGAFVIVGIASWYRLRGRNERFVAYALRTGALVALVATVLMMPASHMQASVVAEQQPTKLAAMEGQYDTRSADMTLFGFVDTENKTVVGPAIPGLTSFLASGDFSTEYPGLDDLEAAEAGSTPSSGMVQATFVSYHVMIAMMAFVCLALLFALVMAFSKKGGPRWMAAVMRWAWVAPFLAIMTGWLTAEFGRQPWIVYGVLKTADAYSKAVPASQVVVTLVLFAVVYAIIVVAFLRLFSKFVAEGPEAAGDPSGADSPLAAIGFDEAAVSAARMQENDKRLMRESAGGAPDASEADRETPDADGAEIVDYLGEDDPASPAISQAERARVQAAAEKLELKPSEQRLAEQADQALSNAHAARQAADLSAAEKKAVDAIQAALAEEEGGRS